MSTVRANNTDNPDSESAIELSSPVEVVVERQDDRSIESKAGQPSAENPPLLTVALPEPTRAAPSTTARICSAFKNAAVQSYGFTKNWVFAFHDDTAPDSCATRTKRWGSRAVQTTTSLIAGWIASRQFVDATHSEIPSIDLPAAILAFIATFVISQHAAGKGIKFIMSGYEQLMSTMEMLSEMQQAVRHSLTHSVVLADFLQEFATAAGTGVEAKKIVQQARQFTALHDAMGIKGKKLPGTTLEQEAILNKYRAKPSPEPEVDERLRRRF